MKIAIEAQRIFRAKKHGMDFVALEAIRELQKIDMENEYFILVDQGEDHCLQESDNMKIIEFSAKGGYPAWEQIALPRELKKIKPDILHCTSNTAPIRCDIPMILTLHDIIFLEKQSGKNPSMYQKLGRIYRRFVVPRILNKCSKIITVSGFECKRIKEALDLPDDQIVSVYNGYSSHFSPVVHPEKVFKKYISSDDYLFFLGNTDPKKNTANTLLAYSIYVKASAHPAKLLIADLDAEGVDRFLKEKKLEWLREYIVVSGYISNSDLPAIYSGAKAFLYTSLRESFGIPILEAMACGTPVITSNTSAIPEIAGEGAILIDPLSPEEIAHEILRLEQEPDYRKKIINYGLERVKLFSWRNTALNLLKLYKEVGTK
ncbi:MAG: glycosyltransferase family 4 protein [Bacteroidales bacterium]